MLLVLLLVVVVMLLVVLYSGVVVAAIVVVAVVCLFGYLVGWFLLSLYTYEQSHMFHTFHFPTSHTWGSRSLSTIDVAVKVTNDVAAVASCRRQLCKLVNVQPFQLVLPFHPILASL